MKLKGLVWFFAIALTIISLWELSYTWVVRNYESSVKAKAEKTVRASFPDLKGDAKDSAIKIRVQRIFDSTKDKSIYPLIGTTYQKCKENELNLGLDLQGGISVTMDVSLEGLLKSLSNNGKDTALLNALRTATEKKANSEADYITLFKDAFIQQNGVGKLSALFAGPGKDVKINDKDDGVIVKIRAIANGAIKDTYKVLVRRIDKFGVAQPNINLDENKGIINVELAGITDVERVRKLLQASAHLQFWEVYRIDELGNSLTIADENLHNFLNGVVEDSLKSKDSAKKGDSLNAKKNVHPFLQVLRPISPTKDKNGNESFSPSIGTVYLKDTSLFFEYINNNVVKSAIPANCKFLFGVE